MLDLLILNTNGDTVRPWITIIIDDFSRAVAGYLIFLGAPTAVQTSLALHQAIWRKQESNWPICGIPDTLYVDHGSDFTSKHLEQVAANLHFQLVFSTVGRPQGRGKIERLFGTINNELLPELPGHLYHGKPSTAPKLSFSELDAVIGNYLINTYNHRTHSTIKTYPVNAWIQNGWLPRMPDSLDELDLLLLTVAKSRVVRRDGIHFQGLRYMHPTLAAYIGESVIIRYDPRDIAEIRIFYRNQFLCHAVSPEYANQTITLKDIQSARSKHRRELRAGINEYMSSVTDFISHELSSKKLRTQKQTASRRKKRKANKLFIYDEDKSND